MSIAAIAERVNIEKVTPRAVTFPPSTEVGLIDGREVAVKRVTLRDHEIWWLGVCMENGIAPQVDLTRVRISCREFVDDDNAFLFSTTSIIEVQTADGFRYQIPVSFDAAQLQAIVEDSGINKGASVDLPVEIEMLFGYDPATLETKAVETFSFTGGTEYIKPLDIDLSSVSEQDYTLSWSLVDPLEPLTTLNFSIDFTASKTGAVFELSSITGATTGTLTTNTNAGNPTYSGCNLVLPQLLPGVTLALSGTATGLRVTATIEADIDTGLSLSEIQHLAHAVPLWTVQIPLPSDLSWNTLGLSLSNSAPSTAASYVFTVNRAASESSFSLLSNSVHSRASVEAAIRAAVIAVGGSGVIFPNAEKTVFARGRTLNTLSVYFTEDPDITSISFAGVDYPLSELPTGPVIDLVASATVVAESATGSGEPEIQYPLITSQKAILRFDLDFAV